MATFVYHNNFHRSNHHTVALQGFPESAADPIASEEFPFQGLFYNNCSDQHGNFVGLSNSYEWWSTYITVTSNYIEWNKFPTTYTSVYSNSANWQNNKLLYTTYNSLSNNWNSLYDTYAENGDYWIRKIDGNQVYGNRVQEYTKQKTFSAAFINSDNVNNIVWNLSSSQVGMYVATDNITFNNFTGAKRGGIYNLVLITDASCISSLSASFNIKKFRFLDLNSNTYCITGIHLRKFQFTYDGSFLLGRSHLYDISPPDRDVYYAGEGILLYENDVLTSPITLETGEALYNAFGLSINITGKEPYDSSPSIIINGSQYNRDFIYSFTSLNALCALSPYGQLGSQDRINIINPNVTMINALTASNSITLKKCDSYDSIQIFTRAYGYISELIINDVEIKDFIFNPSGYDNHETGHVIFTKPKYDAVRTQSIFVKYGNPVPIYTRSLSAGILLWLDAMDYSTVKFLSSGGNNYISGLSSKISRHETFFTSTSSTNSIYNTLPKQSFNYNLSSTHYRDMILSGNTDFAAFTVLTPTNSSNKTEWLWANGNYGIFKIPEKYSLGIGTSAQYFEYEYGAVNKNKPVCVTVRYESNYRSQETFINGGNLVNMISMDSLLFGNPDPLTDYTMIGGLNPLTGFSSYKLHEFILYKERKNNIQINEINNYLLDKWKYL